MLEDRPVNPISPADLDALSAWLDGQLPAAERAALEARLAAEPALRAELDDLRAVVAALHQLPPLRAPRDLTLTPAQVQARPTRHVAVFPAFVSGLSAAAAALLLIAGVGLLRPASLPSSGAETAQVAALATAAGTATQPEPLILREAAPTVAELTEEPADLLFDSAEVTTMQESAAGGASLAAPAAAEDQALESLVFATVTTPSAETANAVTGGVPPLPAGTPAPPGTDALQFQFAAPTGPASAGAMPSAQAQMTLPAGDEGPQPKEATATLPPTASPTLSATTSPLPTATAGPSQAGGAAASGLSPNAGWTLIAGAVVLLGVAVFAGWRARRGV